MSRIKTGGTAILSYWSGIVDQHDQVYLGPYGGPLRPLIGCDVLDVAPLAAGDAVEVEWADGTRTTADFWIDLAAERDGEVLARIASGPWAGSPAVVLTRYGTGSAYYVGTRLDGEGMRRIYDAVPALRGAVSPAGPDGDGVERVVRSSPGHDYEFLINHADTERKVTLAGPGYDMLSGQRTDGAMTLGQRGVAIVRHESGGLDLRAARRRQSARGAG